MRLSPLFMATSSCRRYRRLSRGAHALGVLLVGALPLVLACESDTLKPALVPDDRTLYWDLELNHHAVTLSTTAPYDTLRLVATPRNYLGEPLAGLPVPEFRSADIERVVVTADGMLVAVAAITTPVRVYATLTTGNLKHTDSVFVKVVDSPTPPVLGGLSIHPVPPDSAKIAATNITSGVIVSPSPIKDILPVLITDTSGASIAGLPVYVRISDTTIARLVPPDPVLGGSNFGLGGRHPGDVTIYATTTAFGVTKADTLLYKVGWPVYAEVKTGNPSLGEVIGTFSAPELRVGTGATVVWIGRGFGLDSTKTVENVDVTFAETDLPNVAAPNLADPLLSGPFGVSYATFCPNHDNCANGGNFVLSGGPFIPSLPFPTGFAMRRFPVAGTYEYRSTIYGSQGRVVVVNEQ